MYNDSKEGDEFMKKWALLLAAFSIFLLAGCEQGGLAKPENLQLSEGVLTWDAVNDAEDYIVIVGSTEHIVTETTINLNTLELASGSYNITVVARKGTSLSSPSSMVTFVKEAGITLLAPTITLTDTVLSWQAVANATSYEITINSQTFTTTNLNYDLSTITLADGSYSVTVKAVNGTTKSQASAAQTYQKGTQINQDDLYELLLSMVNPSYEPDMTETDFMDEMDYESYQMTSMMIGAYVDVAVSTNMSQTEALGMMTYLMSYGEVMSNPDPTFIMAKLDLMGTYGMTEERFVTMAVTLGEQMLGIQYDRLSEELIDVNQYVTDLESDLNALRTNANLLAEITALNAYLSPEQQATLDVMFDTNVDARLIFAIQVMAQNLLGSYNESMYDYLYGDETDDYIYLFESILYQINMSSPSTITNIAMSTENWMPFMVEYIYLTSDYQYSLDELNQLNDDEMMISMMLEAFGENSVYLETMLGEITNYFVGLYQAMPEGLPEDIIALITSEQVTPEEVLILKDEVVFMLLDEMPALSSFVAFNQAMMMLYGGIANVDMTTYLTHATTISTIQKSSITLGLEFIYAIKAQQVNDVMAITDGMRTEGYWDDINYVYVEDVIDYSKVSELVIYVATFIDTFMTDQATLIAELEGVNKDQMIIDFATAASVMLKAQLMDELSLAEYQMVEVIIDEALVDIPHFLQLAADFKALGLDLFDLFVTSEGSILTYITDFMMLENQTEESTILFIEGLIDRLGIYHNEINLTLETQLVADFILVIRVPLLAAALNTGVTETEFNLMYQALDSHIETILLNVVALEADIFAVVDSMTNIYQTMLGYGIEMDLAALAMVSLAVEDVLTLQNQLMIELTMDLVFETVLVNPTLMSMLQLDAAAVTLMQTNLMDQYTQVKTDLLLIATYDFNNLTQLQIDHMYDFMSMLNPAPVVN